MNKILLFLLTVLSMSSCTGMYDNIEEYWDRGEIAYIGRPDSAVVYGGKNRAKIEWLVNADPRIEKCIVYWNFREDSVEVDIDRSSIIDGKYSCMLNNLEEGSYVFELVNVGTQGYPSIAHEVIGEVYGSNYESNLSAKKILGFNWSGTALVLNLGNDDSDHTIFRYTDTNGVECEYVCKAGETEAVLENCDPDLSELLYTTVYKPDEDALDTFPIEATYKLPQLLDRTGWTAETIVFNGSPDIGAPEFSADKILDGEWGTAFYSNWNVASSGRNPSERQTFYIDMKDEYSVKDFIMSIWEGSTSEVSISISSDKTDWELLGLIKFPSGNLESSLTLPESKSGRYIKVYLTEGDHLSCREFNVKGFN